MCHALFFDAQVCAALGLPASTSLTIHGYWTLPGGGQLPHYDKSEYASRLVLVSRLSQVSLHAGTGRTGNGIAGCDWAHMGYIMAKELGRGELIGRQASLTCRRV